MSKTKKIILSSVICLLAVLSALLIVGTAIINEERNRQNTAVEEVYQRALYDLSDSVRNLEVNLSKIMIMNGDYETAVLLSDIRCQSELAENSLGVLPLAINETTDASKFFNQISDWATVYSGAVASKRDITEFKRQAKDLHSVTKIMVEDLSEVLSNGGKITSRIGENKLFGDGIKFGLSSKEHTTIEYPELIYDGAFSDAKKYCFHALDGLDEISSEEATQIAIEKLGLEEAVNLGLTNGKTAIYEIEGKIDGEDALVSITQKGGLVIGFNRTKSVKAVTLDLDKAVGLATYYAETLGYADLHPVWKSSENGVACINLTPQVNGVIYYADLVKIKVALSDGSLLGVEASGYCMSHKNREDKPTIAEDTARSLVDESLSVEKVTLAVIPVGEDETLCYELFGEANGMKYFVYIDAYDGEQVKVLRVVGDSCGDMVI